jgi:hypothetical protein
MKTAEAQKLLTVAHRDAVCAKLLAKAARSDKTSPDVSDWLITIQFYSLCLYVRALGLARGRELTNHEDARSWINDTPDLREMARDYRLVETRSREARYDGRLYERLEILEFNERFTAAMVHVLPLLRSSGLKADIVVPLPPEDYHY